MDLGMGEKCVEGGKDGWRDGGRLEGDVWRNQIQIWVDSKTQVDGWGMGRGQIEGWLDGWMEGSMEKCEGFVKGKGWRDG